MGRIYVFMVAFIIMCRRNRNFYVFHFLQENNLIKNMAYKDCFVTHLILFAAHDCASKGLGGNTV